MRKNIFRRLGLKDYFGSKCLLLLFLLIYTSDDTALFGLNINPMYSYIRYAVVAFVLLYLLVTGVKLKNRDLQLLIVIFACFIPTSLLTGLKVGFVYNFLLLLVGFVFVRNFSLEVFSDSFRKIVSLLALFSIVVYFLNLLQPSLFTRFPVFQNVAGVEFINTYFSTICVDFQLRNTSIFREPGAFMVYLNIALFFEWFSNKVSIPRTIVLILAILTTLSTGGFIVGALVITAGLLHKRQVSKAIILLPVAFFVWYVLNNSEYALNEMVLGKLEEGSDSGVTRMASLVVPLDIFITNPLGVGPEAYNDLFPKLSHMRYGYSIEADVSTNTFMKLLAVYGVFIFSFYTVGLYKFTKKMYSRKLISLAFFIVLLLAFSNEDMRTSICFSILVAYGLVSRNEEKIVTDGRS